MAKYHSLSFFIGVAALIVLHAEGAQERSKRQAPNINVHNIPKTSFSCDNKKLGEYYADPESSCQVYHVCVPGTNNKMSLISFVCPNGTIFSQASRVCTPFDRVDCKLATRFYESLHGDYNSRRTDYEPDSDFENYVPETPRAPAPPPRASRSQQPGQSSRDTVPPPQEEPAQPQRTSNRFRSGGTQFRSNPQSRPAQTPPPVTVPPPPPRQQSPAARPVAPAFRPPVPGARPVPTGARPAPVPARGAVVGIPTPPRPVAVAATTRPTVRAVISTSTANDNYEYEYEYDYEDETPVGEAANSRSKREALEDDSDYYEDRPDLDLERTPIETGFTCNDKVGGGVYSDIETDCEMFHICVPLGKHKMADYTVFCANGTAFDQETGTCKSKSDFKCGNAHLFYQYKKGNRSITEKKHDYKKTSYFRSGKTQPSHKQ